MKKYGLAIGAVMTAIGLTACGGEKTEKNASEEPKKEEQAYVEVTHELDKEPVKVPVDPKVVVSFDNGITDSIRALGHDVDGVPKENNIPSYLSELEEDKYEDVGSLFEADFEKIVEMKPDVIFISGRAMENYDELSKIAPTVYMMVDQENYMTSFEENMQTLGEIFDAEDEVDKQLGEIQATIDDVKTRAEATDKNGLILSVSEGAASAFGAGSRFGLIHDVLGVKPADDIPAENHGEDVSFEYIAEKDPDYIFLLDRGATVGEASTAQQVLDNELVGGTKAAKNDKIISLDGGVWYLSGGGLESVKRMVDEIDASFEK
ncbi:siderophore ABC transporter substrate-binding protein [Bacillus sp. FSL W7-1360]